MSKKKYYVVLKGRETGIFSTWDECNKQVHGYSGAIYKSFKTYQEAESALELTEPNSFNLYSQSDNVKARLNPTNSNSLDKIIGESICVDASCIGNPGIIEWRGVDTESGNELFHPPSPQANGTNNIGEFLAIVHGLGYLKRQNKNIPIYSDSQTAIGWVSKKKARTKLACTAETEEIFNLIERAEKWLQENTYENPILKWDTASWGEIPADFGRK